MPELPRQFDAIHELTSARGTWLYRARREGRDVVVRVAEGSGGTEALAELAVLAAVEHPGLARLIEHGCLASGETYVVREWIPGQTLSEFQGSAHERDLVGLIARICPALEQLHARGFVHADLKADNVVIREDGTPILTDYGLSRREGQRDEVGVSGSWFAIAPEVLLGAGADARADLFALGVMLHSIFARELPSPEEFYSRFPGESFLEVVGTREDDLPEWIRDVICQLLERDPSKRLASALEVGRTLASRLGIEIESGEHEAALTIPILTSRESWSAELLAPNKGPEIRLRWSVVSDNEDVEVVADALHLEAALAGRSSRRISLGTELRHVGGVGYLDRFCLELAESAQSGNVIASMPSNDPFALRAVAVIARAVGQLSGDGMLTILAQVSAPVGLGVEGADFPRLEALDVARFLKTRLTAAKTAEVESFAESLVEAGEGSATGVNELLERGLAAGLVLRGSEGLRLRDDAAETLVRTAKATPIEVALESAALLALGVLRLRREPVSIASLGEECRQSGGKLAKIVHELIRGGLAHSVPGSGPAQIVVTARGHAVDLVGLDHVQLHTREAKRLEAMGAPVLRVLAQRWLAGETNVEAELCLEARIQRERGSAEWILQVLSELRNERALGLELTSELALAWAALGEHERATALVDELKETANTPAEEAIAERSRAELAWLRREYVDALAGYERARKLDANDGGRAAVGKATLFFATRREDELDELVGELKSGEWGELEPRHWKNVRMIHAMSQFRRGRVEMARNSLVSCLEEAKGGRDSNYEAVVHINLGTIARRTGDYASAVEMFQRAVALGEEAGLLNGLAQATALLGGTLREAGRLIESESHLRAALGIRERLGDHGGACFVRGMIGLLAADRGEISSSLAELTTSAVALDELGRSAEALILRARADELRSRIGAQSEWADLGESKSAPASFDGDPRILIAHARVAWNSGEQESVRLFLRCAVALAVDLGREGVVEEAQAMLLLLRYCEAPDSVSLEMQERVNPLVAQDEQCLMLLAADEGAFNASRAHSLALELAHCGRLDRATRIYLAVAARSSDAELRDSSSREALHLFSELSRGLTEHESLTCRRHLLGIPDPWPADLEYSSADEEKRLDLDLTLFLEISNRMVAQQDIRTLLGTIVECAMKVTGGTRGFLVLEESGSLSFDTAFDSRRGDINEPEVEISESVIHRALEAMKPLRLSNAVEDPQLGGAPSISAMELRSILCCPFRIDGVSRGVIYVDHRMRTDVFGPRGEMLLEHLGAQAALAIRQVRRLEQIQELNERLTHKIAVTETQLVAAKSSLREVGVVDSVEGMVGNSDAMRSVGNLICQAAQSDLSVLVQGASGTGKELAAKALHALSPWKEGAFISENCAAIPESLIEAELFGYKKGAFTGADRDRVGMFERANGGTIFLDEIGELPLEMQAKLLRVLESGEIRRLGDSVVRKTKFRLVTATNRNLEERVAEGLFRADLLYRLDALRVQMPALSERVEDIPLLVEHFLGVQGAADGVDRKISRAVIKALCTRAWPGNVRELSNEIARLCVLSDGDLVDTALVRTPHGTEQSEPSSVLSLEQVERQAIENALQVTGGDKKEASQLLGISQSKIYQRLASWKD